MSIESLKQKARKAEQNEDWRKALENYNKALMELEREEQVDIGLYNRVGDLYVRVNRLDDAVEHYEKAVELYREAYLPNNAIAVCKKIIRNVPEHHKAYLVIGQIRAEQGFIPDARTNFLTYAERMQQAGDLDESFRALVEFCDLAPDDVGVRITVADQMAAQERTEEAVEQLLIVRRHYTEIGESEKASEIEAKILELDPEADLTAMPAVGGFAASEDDGGLGQFGEISLGADAFSGGDSEEEAGFAVSSAMEEAASEVSEEEDTEEEAELGGFEISGSEGEAEEAAELPTMDFGDDEDDGEAPELPMMEFGDEEDEDEAPELPMMDFDDDEGAVATTSMEDFSVEDADVTAESDVAEAMEEAVEEARSGEAEVTPPAEEPVPDPETTEAPASITPPPPVQEPPAPLEEREAPEPSAQESTAPRQEEEAESAKEEAAPKSGADESFVDLGAMILGDDRDEKSTRFTVAYQEPSGDEEADFAKMLTQFKDKVSENLDSSDVRAHYDLGTAYKEMGLLDEAITSFQAALRASANHLPTYELMGQTFIEMGQPEAAVRSLERALQSPAAVEDELVGIYYYLGRAYEELEKKDSAVDYYDRVFALDINFADVTERLRELR